jgi:hypothetical protein
MNCRVTLGQVYFIGVCLVQTLSFEKFVSEVKDNEENWLSIEQAKEFITYYLKQSGNDDVSVESITVSLICSFDTRMMETPVR